MNSSATSDVGKAAGFRWTEADAYLFDIDGTLVNSRDGVHYNAFHSALAAAWGITARIDEVPVHGNTDIGILRAVTRRQGVSDAGFARGLPAALAQMCAEVERNAAGMQPQVCPEAGELVARLHGRGKLLGVVSGNLESIGWAKLRAAGLRQYFALGSFSDRAELRAEIFRHGIAEARRRLREPATIWVVGDTPADVAAAREAGAPVIAVATGVYDRETLLACAPDVCVNGCTELLPELA